LSGWKSNNLTYKGLKEELDLLQEAPEQEMSPETISSEWDRLRKFMSKRK
jgi:hypothetical protein